MKREILILTGFTDATDVVVEVSRKAIAIKRIGCEVTAAHLKNAIKSGNDISLIGEYFYAGISINENLGSRKTPLFHAAKCGNRDLCALLLDIPGIDPKVTSEGGLTAFSAAVENNHLEVVKLFLNKDNLDFGNDGDNGQNSFLTACENGNLEMVKLLWEYCFSKTGWKQQDGMCNPYLSCCKSLRPFETLKYLVSIESLHHCINALHRGGTALHLACTSFNDDEGQLIDLLLQIPDINPDIVNESFGFTALIFLCGSGSSLEKVKKLVEFGADVNIQTNQGKQTALLEAVRVGELDIVKYLCDHRDIDRSAVSNTGLSAICIAALRNDIPVMSCLTSYGDLNINASDEYGRTPLQISCGYSQLEAVQKLVEHPNVDINTRDIFGTTPLLSLLLGSESVRKIQH